MNSHVGITCFSARNIRSKPCNVEIRGIHGGLPPRGRAKAVQTFGKKQGVPPENTRENTKTNKKSNIKEHFFLTYDNVLK